MMVRTRRMTGRGAAAVAAAVFVIAPMAARAQSAEPGTWSFSPDRGYGYAADGKMLSYKMGTSNAKSLLKGAKKVPRNTLFFVGENGQLYMRSGPYLEGGIFIFGPG